AAHGGRRGRCGSRPPPLGSVPLGPIDRSPSGAFHAGTGAGAWPWPAAGRADAGGRCASVARPGGAFPPPKVAAMVSVA
ncbi:hypothetical protein, partial [Burkholderia thailandensis]|uniref:hypothetical protein n=1 Tax=Burkholderia thailandensis TaxID=57975 RepID=UPI00016A8073